jgi:NAD(P)-dependent dehydrogenase (short-subunit alcohol dehydrogenase family)
MVADVSEGSRPTALVTGAANGLGAALARRLAERGMDLVLIDVDAAGLAVTTEDLRGRGADVLPLHVDLADGPRLQSVLDHVGVEVGPVAVCAPFAAVITDPGQGSDPRVPAIVQAVNVDHVATCGRWAQDTAERHGSASHVVLAGSESGLTLRTTHEYARSKQRVLVLARQLRQRGRRLARASGRDHSVTLATIYPTTTRLVSNSDRVWRRHGVSVRADQTPDERDAWLTRNGRAPEVVVDELLHALDRRRASVSLSGRARRSLPDRVKADVVVPAYLRLAR